MCFGVASGEDRVGEGVVEPLPGSGAGGLDHRDLGVPSAGAGRGEGEVDPGGSEAAAVGEEHQPPGWVDLSTSVSSVRRTG